MDLFQIHKKFNTKARCYKHLEKVRWAGKPVCPRCASDSITPLKRRKFFYHCNKCNRDFTVLMGTIMEGSKLPLPKWFYLIGLMLHSRKGIAAMKLSSMMGVTYKTAWYSAMRVRCAMVEEAGQDLLEGILEMDEVYVGGKPRKRYKKEKNGVAYLSNVSTKRGRGTKKVPVVGIVEREGKKRVRMEIPDKLNQKTMLALLKKYVNTEKAVMMTDEAGFYNKFEEIIQHLIVTHSKGEYVRGEISTNTIDGMWSIIKNGVRGEYHVLSRKYLPFYLAEWAYKYNRRSKQGKAKAFDETIERAVGDEKCLIKYKPKKSPDEIAYGCKVGEADAKKQKPKRKKHRRKHSKRRNRKKMKIKQRKAKFRSKKGKKRR